MATTVDELLIKIRSDMSEFKRDLNKIQTQTKTATKNIDRSFKTMATGIKGAIGAVVAIGVVNLGRSMVQLASDIEEQTSKAKVVFGNNFNDVQKQLADFGDAVGRSTHELVNMGASIQDTFVPMGFARDEASKLSVQLTKLAVDVASFNNASDVETMQAFQSAIVGNHETVRRFGVVITEATLKQELMRMGIRKSADQVTNAEKVQARLNLIIRGTTDAHNDAINTSGSFANSSKALSASLEELADGLTRLFLPALTKTVQFITAGTTALKNFALEMGIISKTLTDVDPFEQLRANFHQTTELIEKLEKENSNFFMKFNAQILGVGLGSLGESEAFKTYKALRLELIRLNKELKLFRDMDEKVLKRRSQFTSSAPPVGSLPTFQDLRNRGSGQNITSQGRSFEDVAKMRVKLSDEVIDAMQTEALAERDFSDQRLAKQQDFFKNTKKFTDDSIKLSLSRIKALEDELARTTSVTNQLRDTSVKAFDRIADATADLLDGTTKDFDGIRSAMSMFLKDLQRTILQLTLFNNIKNKIFGTNLPTASGGDIFDNIIGLFSGTGGGGTFGSPDSFAKGGRVQRGRPYLVGERGAEMFVPNTGGTIMNNMNTRGIGGGSTVVNQTINVDAGVSQTVRAEIINLLPVIKQDTISSLLEAKRRGGSFATALA
mgnify:CR=1